MFKVITRILIPAATAVVADTTDLQCCKRSELPIYSPEPMKKKEKHPQLIVESGPPGVIEESIGTVRKTLFDMCNEVKQYERTAVNYVNDGVAQADWLIKYLGEDDNPTPKGPAIAIGGLTGFIFALRGGIFRKVVFTSAGALGMAAVCFPKEAQYYSQVGLEESRKYAKIAYNFIYGVKKGDPALELPTMPKLPGSFSEAWTMVSDLGKSASSVVSDKVSKVEHREEKFMALGLSSGGSVEIKKRACHSAIDGSLVECPDDFPVPEAPVCQTKAEPECSD